MRHVLAKDRPQADLVETTPIFFTDRLQDISQHHAHNHKLDERQQAVLARLRGEPAGRLCRAAGRRPRAGRAVVLQHLLRRAARRTRDGPDAGRGPLHQRRAARQRHHRDEGLANPVH